MFDVIVRGGTVVDGSGDPGFQGDVAIKDGRIAAVGQVSGEARQVIDASGRIVAPGFIDTEMTQLTARRLGFEPDDYKAQRAKTIAVGRVGVPQDVAATIAFLASEAASFVNGQIIYVSGGPETRR